mmetsp:Transcript_15734/g.40552  ORF Transcript_15734/g.40552 Transcript_15734/m.40552 type:complete len:204 (+) Transcript_15734:616-1227(+)
MESSFCLSSSRPWMYSSRTSSQSAKVTGPAISSSSQAPISSSPYSSSRNARKSSSLGAAGCLLLGTPSSSSFSSSSSSSSSTSPPSLLPPRPSLAVCMALKAARSGRCLSSAALGPQTSAVSSTAMPEVRISSPKSSSISSYSSAKSRARSSSASSVVKAGCMLISFSSGRPTSAASFTGTSSTTPPTPPPLPTPLTRLRCWS